MILEIQWADDRKGSVVLDIHCFTRILNTIYILQFIYFSFEVSTLCHFTYRTGEWKWTLPLRCMWGSSNKAGLKRHCWDHRGNVNMCWVFNNIKGIMVTCVECDHGMVLKQKQIWIFLANISTRKGKQWRNRWTKIGKRLNLVNKYMEIYYTILSTLVYVWKFT